jgi:hypothetical protein
MRKASNAKLWLFVLGGFACLITAYVFAFKVARVAQIRDVSLATQGAKP